MELSYRDRIGECLASMYGDTFAEGKWWYENPDEDKFFAALFQRASGGKPLSQVDVARVFLKGDKRQINIHEPALRKVGLSKDALRDLFCVTKAAGGTDVVEVPPPEGDSVAFGEVPAVEEDDDSRTIGAAGAMEEDQDLSGCDTGSYECGGADDALAYGPGADIWGEKSGFENDVVSWSQPLEDVAIGKLDDIFEPDCSRDDGDATDRNAQLYPVQTWLKTQAEVFTDGISGQLRGSPMEKSLIPHVEAINKQFSAMSAKVTQQIDANNAFASFLKIDP
jgi:hypothetical protein